MANFKVSMDLLKSLEFTNPTDVLHKNKIESDITYFGIYRIAHPNWSGWQKVDEVLSRVGVLSEASKILFADEWLQGKVYQFYKTNFWDMMKLDNIHSQKIADEMFCFGVNAGVATSVKIAQKLVGIECDGVIGAMTISALNACDEARFDNLFDMLEMEHYEKLIAKNPRLSVYHNGWNNRANKI
ncbi:glycosyl hydrolase 108 family protein [Campylobacter hyointestinalis]|uniref:Predicted Peptidoglycan domain n=1 Tax=Campylobacter hyointestinalis subsp. hyointestinalis TaxID=91352 RepID=A0A9W5AP62_CAMHY|nr:glycosyl hydrolase 108 family protein [Campylobacter hyointestinalis]CUU74367.1 Predicted Peptidoglycan domain [Campylobacter hyointestinalis subsp. hyointestinalis]CUU82161.1 Predicted Peptidoglycan domain [Campylobacter hyointestinalis subsp. hyointestinalis]